MIRFVAIAALLFLTGCPAFLAAMAGASAVAPVVTAAIDAYAATCGSLAA